MSCKFEVCDGKAKCRDMCDAHYQRWRKGWRGDRLSAPIPRQGRYETCTVDWCGRDHLAKGFCSIHYKRQKGEVDRDITDPIRKVDAERGCAVVGCDNNHYAKDVCEPHYKKARVRELKKMLIRALGGRCERCGCRRHPAAMSFHHTNPNKKDGTVTSHLQGSVDSLFRAVQEASDCKLVCANCHREIHYEDVKYEWSA